MKKIEYIYEDEDIIVCHKPAGIATEGAGPGKMDLVSQVRNYLTRKSRQEGKKGPAYVGTVYRLDQPVEGVVVMGKNKKATSSLAEQIKKHTTDKYYYALCYGDVEPKEGHVENYLGRREDSGLAIIVSEEEKVRLIGGDVKKAELDYEVVSSEEKTSLMRIKLLTGRFHQIRVQMAGLGYPIIGDTKYGTKESLQYSEEKGIKTVCLACYKFGFKHPTTGKRVFFEIKPEFIDHEN
ncbi:RluA family pseudouridine synthase [Butyrivibrio sp. AE2015]|uniref:RluA family pseudouridine synthase n=1 Tax=Butyrivibrio sp. AE2015 TaxID=1280663 RepID=UPI0003B4F25A|nr:RluA family pseudouridine synthase [Butyrivibrio sp. AE2015]